MGSGTVCPPGPGGPSSGPGGSRDATGCPPRRGGPAIRPQRIGDRRTFAALRRSSCRVRRGPVTVTWVGGDPTSSVRVGYAIGRKVGGAVERNRLRRRLRAICAEAGAPLMAGSYLLAVAPGASQLTFRELRAYVYQALEALAASERAGER